ncbi:transcription termination factor 3, mitochondrial isoform X2 [Salarias fasciatus]|uniref:Transcription termination factor 3, mitochondrial n=2 Tax=Salarias fasciatus TaxID=181472 RepID=A0A672J3T3_SALFA|nr:transcription termination factor 3, mitochondrial isoform X2 [Salarias fasciatus]
MTMASACVQLCLRCRSPVCTKAGASTWKIYTQLQRCISTTRIPTNISSGLFSTRDHRTVQSGVRWKQEMCYYNGLMVKYLTTEAKDRKQTDELSRSDAVVPQNPLLPNTEALLTTESHTSLADLDAPELSPLEEISSEEAISISVPSIPPMSTTLSDYVDASETLTKLVQLGVNLFKLEQRPNVGSMLLRLDFDREVAPRLLFLKDIGVEDSRFGHIISHNPFILTESLENLEARVNYLKSKNFTAETIASMVSRAPYLLNFSVKRLDNRLAFYQQQLKLSASNTRNIVARLPRLLCGSLEPVKENLQVCKIEFGFKENEIQHIVIAVPKVLTANKRKLTQIFDFLHNTMKVPHSLITKFPQTLNCKFLRLRERHLFLEYLGKAQYDPTQTNYISLDRLVSLPDEAFCSEVALASLEDFDFFQKTL